MSVRTAIARLATVTALLAGPLLFTPTAEAIPGLPTCPGNGNDTVVVGADGGWCDFLFLPDGSHVSCRWADFSLIIADWGGHSECRRVDQAGNLLPGSPPWETFKDWGNGERAPAAPAPNEPPKE